MGGGLFLGHQRDVREGRAQPAEISASAASSASVTGEASDLARTSKSSGPIDLA